MRIYELRQPYDSSHDSVYEAVGPADPRLHTAFVMGRKLGRSWAELCPLPIDYRRLAEPEDRLREIGDFPIANYPWVFSKRASAVLGKFLKGAGELLPIRFEGGDDALVAFGPTRTVDALDYERAQVVHYDKYDLPLTGIRNVKTFAFRADRLVGIDLFSVPEAPTRFFVSQRLVDRIHEAGLVGFEPLLIWTDE